MREAKVIYTIGSTGDNEEMSRKLMFVGMSVARFNFSHDTREAYAEKSKCMVRLRRELGLLVATLLGTKGPEIRLRDLKNGLEVLEKGAKLALTTRELLGDNTIASASYKDLPSDVQGGGVILVDDDLTGLRADEVDGTEIHCMVENGGKISNRKSVNIPSADLSIPFIFNQDRNDIEFSCRMDLDYITASFTRTAVDVHAIRETLDVCGSKMKVIAEIESVQDMKNIKEIFKEVDGVMVARDDLGVEVPTEDIPVVQKDIIKLDAKMGKVAIMATRTFDPMVHNPRPMRAKITSVVNAIYDDAMTIILSGETVAGSCPTKTVEMMNKTAEKTEQDINYSERRRRLETKKQEDATTAISHATCTVAKGVRTKAVVMVTISGFTVRRLTRYRLECSVIACTVSQTVARRMNLLLDVIPVLIPQEDSADMLSDVILHEAKEPGLVSEDDMVILTTGPPLGVDDNTNTIRVVEVI